MGCCAVRPGRRIRLSVSGCLARFGEVASAVGLCAAELWLVGCWVVASLGLGSARAVWLTLVLAKSSLATLRACRISDLGSSLQGACEA